MIEFVWIAGMFALGGALAAAWLFGLWLNVRSLARRSRPRVGLALGAPIRLALVAGGFYLVIAGGRDWVHLVAALAGFMMIRYLVLTTVRRRLESEGPAPGDPA
jgi:F1F0 ATPase subunit 2